MRHILAVVVLAGLGAHPLAVCGQELPEALKDKALVVRVNAIVPAAVSGEASQSPNLGQPWEAESSKYTVPGTPVPFKLVGSNVAIIVQITPFEREDGKGVTLIAQGQVWVRPAEGGLSYHTTIESLSVDYGETVLFFPLGVDGSGNAPMKLEISVVRAPNAGQDGGPANDKAGN